MPDEPLIYCVKVGDRYGDEYVTRLRDGVARHLPAPHKFVCLTERSIPGVKCWPIIQNLPANWWSKLELFTLDLPVVYFDLDVVITGDLTPLMEVAEFTILKDWWSPGFNSSVMVLTGKERHVWENFAKSPKATMRRCAMGDQQWITEQMGGAKTFPPEFFPSYKANDCTKAVPKGALAVIFHGRPKMAEIKDGWVPQLWV